MSNLVSHAKRELELITAPGDVWQEEMNRQLISMVELFSSGGHSGMSSAYAQALLAKLLAFEPVSPLTGRPDEWTEVSEGLFQNKRCSRVFKDSEGKAWDIDGKVFRDPDGTMVTNWQSKVEVTFPYTPTTEIIDRTPDTMADLEEGSLH